MRIRSAALPLDPGKFPQSHRAGRGIVREWLPDDPGATRF
jgi:hypothetical protein